MAEYLKREDVLSDADIISVQTREYGTIDVVPLEYLADLPTADVVEVKHGRWLNKKFHPTPTHKYPYRLLVCSECCDVTTTPFKYCPYCGAKMDGTPKERGGE